jgi:hypothetical protein
MPTPPVFLPPAPAPAPAQQPTQPAARDDDPIVGTWVTSNGAWHFAKDGDGYALVETSALGQSGQGRAKLEGAILSVDFRSAVLGQMSLTLALDGRVLHGTMPLMGIPLPLVLQRM